MTSELKLGEVKLRVRDLKRSLAFYEQVLGMQCAARTATTAELTAAGRGAMLVVLEEVPGAVETDPRSVSGLYHYALLVPSRRDLGLVLRQLLDHGVHVGQGDHHVSEALYLSDPDNNGIEIYRDRPREEWTYAPDGSIRMTTDPLDIPGILGAAEGEAWRGMPAGTRMGHVHFHVRGLAEAKRFYTETLGFDTMVDYAAQMGAVFVSAGGYHHHIGLNIWAGAGAPPASSQATGLAYYTMRLPGAELERLRAHLERSGVTLRQQDGAWLAADPSGIVMRLLQAEPVPI
ncbi:VOC family protein [Paenibacillus sp. IB182496]|uniref:VOC family protein n=2 Tax=Paenibacillus sabuli TaxID=2772509 RepID=A0A927BU65_9BACL|nr:VOC family protein [Paenibacillus sabuli]